MSGEMIRLDWARDEVFAPWKSSALSTRYALIRQRRAARLQALARPRIRWAGGTCGTRPLDRGRW